MGYSLFRMSYVTKLLVALLLLVFVLPVYAQEAAPEEVAVPESSTPLNCFDWYRFGSVKTTIATQADAVLPGGKLSFKGTIENTNAYPIPHAVITAKVFKRNDETFSAGFQNEVVDYILVEEKISLSANDAKEISFDWSIPVMAEGGEYYVAYYVTTKEGFPLSGLLYSDDIIGDRTSFEVIANSNETAAFVKAKTTINDKAYTFSASDMEVEGDVITVTAVLENPTAVQKIIPLQWNQYANDVVSEENLRNTKTEVVTLAPGEQKNVSYTVKEQREARVLVTAVTEDSAVKSTLFTRFLQAGVSDTTIGFHTLSGFPLGANQPFTLAACIGNNGNEMENHTVTMTLKDSVGTVLHSYTYTGDIPPANGGFGEQFTLPQDYNSVVLTTTVEKDGTIVASKETAYDCNSIDPNSCIGKGVTPGLFDSLQKYALMIFIALTALVVLIVLLVLYLKKRSRIDNIVVSTTSLSILALIMGGVVALNSVPAISTAMYFAEEIITVGVDDGASDFPPPTTLSGDADIPSSNSVSGVIASQPSNPASCPNVSVQVNWQSFGTTNDYAMYSGSGNAKGNRLYNNCPVNTPIGTEIRDDNDSARALTEDNYRGPTRQQLCLGTTDPDVDLGSGWFEGSCPAGSIDMGVYDSDDSNYSNPAGKRYYHKHDFNEEDNTSNDLRWCLGVTSPNDNYELQTRKVPGVGTCAADESYLFYSDDTRWNMNNEDNPNRTSLCVKVTPKTGATCGVPYPTADMTINGSGGPITVAPNAPLSIAWSSTDAASCTVSSSPASAFSGARATSGTESHTFGSTATTYSITCSNASGTVTDSVTVNVAAPVVDLTINGSDGPLNVNKTDTLSIAWSTTNVSSCTLYGAGLPGGAVAVSGTNSVSASVITSSPESYVLSCDGTVDSVPVSVVNRVPNPPAISGPTSTTGGASNSFAITGTDPDNDTIFYEVDWDNNGSVDAYLPASGFVSSGVTLGANRSWLAAGTYTIQARTVDFDNARSSWTQHTITVTSSIPATATLEVSSDGGSSWGTGDITVNSSDSVALRWSSSNSTSCTGSGGNFSPSGISGSSNVNTPAANSYIDFRLTCTGAGGASPEEVIRVTTRQLPNLTVGQNGSPSYGAFDAVTASYNEITINIRTQNNGGSDTGSSVDYRLEFDINGDGDFDDVGETVDRADGVGAIAVGGGENDSETITGPISIGSHAVKITIDSGNDVQETTEGAAVQGDNIYTGTITVPPQDPGLSITASPLRVQNGQNSTISWTINTPYSGLNCSVSGPGMTPVSFSLPGVSTGSRLAGPITSKSEYTMTCTIAGTTFTDTVTVEAEGVIEEI